MTFRSDSGPAPDAGSVPDSGSPPAAGSPFEAAAVTVRSPADLIVAVPYLLGFQPADSIVVVALSGGRLFFTARADLPHRDSPAGDVSAAVQHLAAVVARQGGTAAAVVAYGDTDRVGAIMPLLRGALAGHRLKVVEALRVDGGRYWSALCDNPRCCPPEGTPYDPFASPVAAAATYAGQLVLPDRATLAKQVAPLTGPRREAMRQATDQAAGRLADLLAGAPGDGSALRTAGAEAVGALLAAGRAGHPPTDDDVAWASVLLAQTEVRDAAFERITDELWQPVLWSEVVRRVQPRLVPAPASLLAFAAWHCGDGALANVALDRAFAEDPGYELARLLRAALDHGIPPSALPRPVEEPAGPVGPAQPPGGIHVGSAKVRPASRPVSPPAPRRAAKPASRSVPKDGASRRTGRARVRRRTGRG